MWAEPEMIEPAERDARVVGGDPGPRHGPHEPGDRKPLLGSAMGVSPRPEWREPGSEGGADGGSRAVLAGGGTLGNPG